MSKAWPFRSTHSESHNYLSKPIQWNKSNESIAGHRRSGIIRFVLLESEFLCRILRNCLEAAVITEKMAGSVAEEQKGSGSRLEALL